MSNPSINVREVQRNPLLGWLAIGALIIFCVIGIATGAASLFRPGYVVLSLAVGIFLYFRYPMLYMGFLWWVWFITPLLSRLIDWRSSFDESRFILVAQYLVTLVTLHTVIKDLPKSYRQGVYPLFWLLQGYFMVF